MAVPSRRHRAGKIEIDNKKNSVKPESEYKEDTPEERAEKEKILREAGLLK